MISAVFIDRFRHLSPLFLILLIGLFLRLYKIGQAFPLDHDQEVVAASAFDFFKHGKLTLVGQELSFPGFFLGPLHNWIGFIPYGLCNLKPDCTPYFYTAIGLPTAIIIYFVAKAIFDSKVAFVTGLIYATSFVAIGFERGASSNFFLILSQIGLLFCLWKFFKGKKPYLIFGSAIAGLATVNFNPVFIFSSVAFFAASLLKKRKQLKLYIFAVLAFLINYLPLVIFNFRHENILLKSFGNFVALNTADSEFLERLIYLVKSVAGPFYSNYLFQSASPIFITVTTVAIAFGFYSERKNSGFQAGAGANFERGRENSGLQAGGIYSLIKTRQKFLLFLPIWIFTALLGFAFYSGPIPDYYFMQTLIPIIILVSLFATRNLIFLTVFLSLFLFTNFAAAQNYSTIINYKIKKQAIDYITNDAQGKSFNVYYDLPRGLNTGYSYLLKAKGREPQEGGQNLYIIDFKNPREFDLKKYQSSFSVKNVQVTTFGYLHVVSIK